MNVICKLFIVLVTSLLLLSCGQTERDRHKYSYKYEYLFHLPDSSAVYRLRIYYNGKLNKVVYRVKPTNGLEESLHGE